MKLTKEQFEEMKRLVAYSEETAEALEDISQKLASGEIQSCAFRLVHTDGSYDDVVVGGTDTEQEIARAILEKVLNNATIH